MVTSETVTYHDKGYSIRADVELVDGQAVGLTQVFLETDGTTTIYIHASELTQWTMEKLYELAEQQHEYYLEASEENNYIDRINGFED